jgi:hypothetical protein
MHLDRSDAVPGIGFAVMVLRHRPVSERVFGEKLIVARPRDGAPVVMEPNAAIVWRQLDDWTTPVEIDRRLGEVFPGTADEVRVTTRAQILGMLENDDLIERG